MDLITVIGILAAIVGIAAGVVQVIDYLQKQRAPAQRRGAASTTSAVPPETPSDQTAPPTVQPEDSLRDGDLLVEGTLSAVPTQRSLTAPAAVEGEPMLEEPGQGIESVLQRLEQLDQDTNEVLAQIAHDVLEGKCVFMIGAGCSIQAGMPSGRQLTRLLKERAHWSCESDRLPDVAQTYVDHRRRGDLEAIIYRALRDRERARELDGSPTIRPTLAHQALARIASLAPRMTAILTTNWDRLLEQALSEELVAYTPVASDQAVTSADPKHLRVVKLHGDVELRGYTIAREDFDNYASNHPRLVELWKECLRNCTLVVVGYGLEDRSFLDVYRMVLSTMGNAARPFYVVLPRTHREKRQHWQERMGVSEFLDLDADTFTVALYRRINTFANRQKELDLVHRLLQGLDVDGRSKRVIEFYGVPGIGKTSLLKCIRDTPDTIPTTLIHLNEHRFQDQVARQSILAQMCADLAIDETEDEETFVRRLAPYHAMFLFDATDRVDEQTLRWLGDLLRRLPRAFAVFAGRRPRLHTCWRGSAALTGELARPRRLGPFAMIDARQQIERELFWDRALAESLYNLTEGHPGIIREALQWLKQRRASPGWSAMLRDERQMGSLLEGWIDRCILNDVEPDLRPIVKQVAFLRSFSPGDLRFILPDGREQPVGYFDGLIKERLMPTGLIDWQRLKVYRLDPTVQRLILRSARLKSPQQFAATCRQVQRLYDTYIESRPERCGQFVVEKLYHLASEGYALGWSDDDLKAALLQMLETDLARADCADMARDVQEVLENDIELQELVPDIYPDLLRSVGQISQRFELGQPETDL